MTTVINPPVETELRIFVVAASPVRRANLAEMGVRVARARAATAPGFILERMISFGPGVVVVDVDSAESAQAVLRASVDLPTETGIIVLIDSPDSHWVARAMAAGVSAILSRDVLADELRLAIMAAETGLIVLHPSSVQRFAPPRAQTYPEADSDISETLTAREQGILRLLGEGMGNKEIATRLSISEHTVKFHVSSILAKLGAASRTEAVSHGIRSGLIPI